MTLLLTLLGAGLGASSVNPTQEQHPFAGLGTGALIWMVITGIVAFFLGGWVAGYGSGWLTTRSEAATHGFVAWALASIIGVWFITGTASNLLSGSIGLIGQTLSGGVQAASQSPDLSAQLKEELTRRGIDLNSIRQQAQSPDTQQKAEQTARQAGEKVAKGVSMASLGGFGMLLLDLIACVLGGVAAGRRAPADLALRPERAA